MSMPQSLRSSETSGSKVVAGTRTLAAPLPVPQAERPGASDVTRLRHKRARAKDQTELARLDKLRSAGQFAAWIAHEVNQPIGAIAINCDAALRWLANDTPNLPEVEAAILRIIRDTSRAVSVVNKTLGMLSNEKLDFVDIDINEVVQDVLLLSQDRQRLFQVDVRTMLLADLPPIRGDRIQLQQVVLNLVLNAIDAMKAVEDRPRTLRITSRIDASGDVLLEVQDSGTGVKPDDLDHLFDHFFTTKADGVGIGLPISRAIVEAHGGRLWASPPTSGGATFQFTLPRPADAGSAPLRNRGVPGSPTTRRRAP
jgi:signal transduction histidine kinase